MSRSFHFALATALILQTMLSPYAFAAAPRREARAFEQAAAALLQSLTPAERVGQLFIVSFQGASAGPNTAIYDLIVQSHIGGVVLLARQDNFAGEANLPAQTLELTNDMQSAALGLTLPIPPSPAPDPAATQPPQEEPGELPPDALFTPVPLFIAVQHEGGGSRATQIHNGLTELPSPMALGATWDPARSEAMGQIAGQELAAIGVNMLLGPSLDVLFNPRPEAAGDLGSRAFGGDPYWVGQLGSAFIRGVHAGSDGRVLVMAQHFPGLGSSDRPPAEEIATVLKSLEQLKQIELAPFFQVTGRAADPSARADGLLISHIRYQGFQGNIRQTTRPVSLDPQAFALLFDLPELSAWRQTGGLVMSDSLGVRAIRRFYDPTERTFQARNIALDAFLAGNDLLLLTEFGQNPPVDQPAQIRDVIASFVQKYGNDPAFAERVDAAAMRILARKLELYGGTFAPERVLGDPAALSNTGRAQAAVLAAAQAAVTLISPSPAELAARLPNRPALGEQILIFTDTREVRQCSQARVCPPRPILGVDTLKEDILRLYGPGAGNLVRGGDIISYSFAELSAYLRSLEEPPLPANETPEPPSPLELALDRADWIIFAMLNVDPAVRESRALKDFLAARPDAGRTQNLVAFAFDAPYYLDTTEISKLTAYYGLYSPAGPFHDVATRVLFQEMTPRGASPVSIPAVAYDLIERTRPDPAQVIEIFIGGAGTSAPQAGTPTAAGGTPAPATPTQESTPEQVGVGETIPLLTGFIRDHNGHAVPDGTIVRFLAQYPTDGLTVPIPDAPTVGGVARASFIPPRRGQIHIRAESEPAYTSITLQITIQEDIIAVTIQPTLAASETPAPTATLPSATPPPPEDTPTPQPPPQSPEPPSPGAADFLSLLGGLVILGVVGLRLGNKLPAGRGRRLALFAALGALVGYNYYALGLPGANALGLAVPVWGATLLTWIGGLAGLALGWLRYGRTRAFPTGPTART